MRSDVHLAALKAAARVAFSITLLNACSTPGGEAAADDKNDGDEGSSYESELVSDKEASKDPCPSEDAGPTTPVSCEATLAAAFPTPGDYRWEPEPQSADVVACCDEELSKNSDMSAYRWDCCVAYDPAAGDAGLNNTAHGLACTPWGPPVPPSMDRARRAKREVAAWLEARAA